MMRISLVIAMMVSGSAQAGEQWYNCKFKKKRAAICSSNTQYETSLRFCREVVPDALYRICERAASDAIGGMYWTVPVCKATHSACVE